MVGKRKELNEKEERERDLGNSIADKFAAKNNVTEQDCEVAVSFKVLRLLIKNMSSNRSKERKDLFNK
ncbi:unnamed protein product [Camellia sinensis]